MVSVADWLTPLRLPVMVAVAVAETAVVVTVKVPVVAPAATVTDAGTVALVLLEDKATDVPPLGAGPLKVTVPVEGLPPMTDVGLSLRLNSPGGLMVRVAVWFTPLKLPVIVALVVAETAVVVTVKVPLVEPAATVTDAGTVALVLLDDKATDVPPLGAGPLKVTVP